MNLYAPRTTPIAPGRTDGTDMIDRVEAVIVDLPFRRLQRFARYEAQAQSSLIIRLTSAAGVHGIGEAIVPCGPWWSGDSVEAMKATFDTYIAPLLMSAETDAPAVVMARIDKAVRGNAFIKAGVEMALLDLLGHALQTPVATLLGGAHRTDCAVAWPLASGDLAKDCAEIDAMLGSGRASAFKVKMGAVPLAEDLKAIEAYMIHLDGRAGLRVDPNEAWSEAQALPAVAALEGMGIDFVEQPLPRHHTAAMGRLAAKTRLPIMIDEGACNAAELLEAATIGAAQIVSLKVMKAGGLMASRQMAALANTSGMIPYLGTFLETSLGTAAGLHLAASLPELPFGGEIIGPMLLAEDITTDPIRYENGAAQLPAGPGLGVAIDEDRLTRFARTG